MVAAFLARSGSVVWWNTIHFWKSNFERWLGTAQQFVSPAIRGSEVWENFAGVAFSVDTTSRPQGEQFSELPNTATRLGQPQALQGDVGEPTLSPKMRHVGEQAPIGYVGKQ